MYVIKKGNYYVSISGRQNSYTNQLKYARLFVTPWNESKHFVM